MNEMRGHEMNRVRGQVGVQLYKVLIPSIYLGLGYLFFFCSEKLLRFTLLAIFKYII